MLCRHGDGGTSDMKSVSTNTGQVSWRHMLAAVPLRNTAARVEPRSDGTVRLSIMKLRYIV